MKIKRKVRILLYVFIVIFSIYGASNAAEIGDYSTGGGNNFPYPSNPNSNNHIQQQSCDTEEPFDLVISEISLSNGGYTVALYSIPSINIEIINDGSFPAEATGGVNEGFISCIEKKSGNEIFRSEAQDTFALDSGESIIAGNLKLKDSLTQTQRTVDIECFINQNGKYNVFFENCELETTNNSKEFSFNVDKIARFDSSMDRAINPIKGNLDPAEPNSLLGGGDAIRSFVFNKIANVVTPIIIIVGIAVGIVGTYKLFFSSNADDTKKGIQLIVYGMLGIIIILSSKYVGNIIFTDIMKAGNATSLNGVELVQILYDKIAYPFIKILIYLVLGFLFIVLAGKVFSFITKTDGSGQKQAITTIAWSIIAMLLIIGSKQIVEAIYGKQDQVMNYNAQNLGELGSGILANKNIPIFYKVINWAMGLTSLVVLIIIIFQTFKILINPDKAENRQTIGKSIIYILVGVLIIGTGYVLTNFLVIN